MFIRFCDYVTAIVEAVLAMGFFALIVTVSFQVLGRTLLSLPSIWTLDLAQLLFTWLIFLGAAVALRMNVHYVVDVLPPLRLFAVVGVLGTAMVVYILVVPGWSLANLRASAVIPSLDLSMFWAFLALPVSGALMALYTLEYIYVSLKGPVIEQRTEGTGE